MFDKVNYQALFESDCNQLSNILNGSNKEFMSIIGNFEYDYIGEAQTINDINAEEKRKSFLIKVMEFIKNLIEKIKNWIDEKLKLTERRFNNNIKKLLKYTGPNGETYKDIEVETVQNINNLGNVISKLEKSKAELVSKGLLEIPETIKRENIFKKGYDIIQILKGKYLDGYVSVYKPYNGKPYEEIRESEFGKIVTMKNVNIAKFESYYNLARDFKRELDNYYKEYKATLNKINLALNVADKANLTNPNTQILLSKIVQVSTHFFTRNIDLITKITLDLINITVSTTEKMVRKIKD